MYILGEDTHFLIRLHVFKYFSVLIDRQRSCFFFQKREIFYVLFVKEAKYHNNDVLHFATDDCQNADTSENSLFLLPKENVQICIVYATGQDILLFVFSLPPSGR